MKTQILNFVWSHPLFVETMVHPNCGPLVLVLQSEGSMSFQHSMLPEQAREMAAALLAAADELDAIPAKVAA